ncbi:MAG: hypothetical protein KDD10_19910, partial [Phaeodactylibacter sp.]|nr:hypothetical protein [Phaeodactylibacter sp.]
LPEAGAFYRIGHIGAARGRLAPCPTKKQAPVILRLFNTRGTSISPLKTPLLSSRVPAFTIMPALRSMGKKNFLFKNLIINYLIRTQKINLISHEPKLPIIVLIVKLSKTN